MIQEARIITCIASVSCMNHSQVKSPLLKCKFYNSIISSKCLQMISFNHDQVLCFLTMLLTLAYPRKKLHSVNTLKTVESLIIFGLFIQLQVFLGQYFQKKLIMTFSTYQCLIFQKKVYIYSSDQQLLDQQYPLMNPRYLKKEQASSINHSTSSHKNQNSRLGHSQRKSNTGSLTKTPLADLTNDPLQYKSQKKFSLYDLPVQSNSLVSKQILQKGSSSNISASKWLDSQKEMMEFILNLKAKKNDQRVNKGKKVTQGFEIDQRRQETQQFLCNKMLFIKKIQKYEKEAINYFYEKDYERSFGQLAKAEALIRKQKIQTVQHQLYINYLYSEFYYKMNDFEKWKTYLQKAKYFTSKINANQSQQMKEYIMNVSALEICLASHQQLYEKVLQLVDTFRNCDHISSKIRRRVRQSHITALQQLCKYKEAMEIIDKQCEALQTDNQINNQKQAQQIGKLLALKIQLTAQYTSTERAIELLQNIIGFEDVANGTNNNFSYYHLKVYQLFAELLKKDEENKLKIIFFYQKWSEIEPSKKEKLKLSLQLFKIYYQFGIYQRALELFDEISCENVVYLGPQYLYIFANIKHSYGDRKEAVSIMSKIIDICQDDDAKILNSFRILEFDLEQQGASVRHQREKLFEKGMKSYNGANYDSILELYCEYLRKRGEPERAEIFANKYKRTANFQEFYFNNPKSQKKINKK